MKSKRVDSYNNNLMSLKSLKHLPESFSTPKNSKLVERLHEFKNELNERQLSEESVKTLNEIIDELNKDYETEKAYAKQVKKKTYSMAQTVLSNDKLVVKNHHRNQKMIFGMTIFGMPLGMIFGFALDNLAFLGIGLPIGMAIGMAIGADLDNKAKKEGRVLNFSYEM
ncbi:MAG: hypothetical protein JXQ87_02890 [Bacteroidia bacterium]